MPGARGGPPALLLLSVFSLSPEWGPCPALTGCPVLTWQWLQPLQHGPVCLCVCLVPFVWPPSPVCTGAPPTCTARWARLRLCHLSGACKTLPSSLLPACGFCLHWPGPALLPPPYALAVRCPSAAHGPAGRLPTRKRKGQTMPDQDWAQPPTLQMDRLRRAVSEAAWDK